MAGQRAGRCHDRQASGRTSCEADMPLLLLPRRPCFSPGPNSHSFSSFLHILKKSLRTNQLGRLTHSHFNKLLTTRGAKLRPNGVINSPQTDDPQRVNGSSDRCSNWTFAAWRISRFTSITNSSVIKRLLILHFHSSIQSDRSASKKAPFRIQTRRHLPPIYQNTPGPDTTINQRGSRPCLLRPSSPPSGAAG